MLQRWLIPFQLKFQIARCHCLITYAFCTLHYGQNPLVQCETCSYGTTHTYTVQHKNLLVQAYTRHTHTLYSMRCSYKKHTLCTYIHCTAWDSLIQHALGTHILHALYIFQSPMSIYQTLFIPHRKLYMSGTHRKCTHCTVHTHTHDIVSLVQYMPTHTRMHLWLHNFWASSPRLSMLSVVFSHHTSQFFRVHEIIFSRMCVTYDIRPPPNSCPLQSPDILTTFWNRVATVKISHQIYGWDFNFKDCFRNHCTLPTFGWNQILICLFWKWKKVKVKVCSLVSSTMHYSSDFTQLPPGHRTCSFISYLNYRGSIQPCCHHNTGNYSNTQKPSLSCQVLNSLLGLESACVGNGPA